MKTLLKQIVEDKNSFLTDEKIAIYRDEQDLFSIQLKGKLLVVSSTDKGYVKYCYSITDLLTDKLIHAHFVVIPKDQPMISVLCEYLKDHFKEEKS
jgi:hypothetical protein